jgi:hypothetical protein
MPYNKRKQSCNQSDGDKGSYVLSYTDKKGKKHRACHTSKKKMQGQIAAIEAESDELEGEVMEESKTFRVTNSGLRYIIREILESKEKEKKEESDLEEMSFPIFKPITKTKSVEQVKKNKS